MLQNFFMSVGCGFACVSRTAADESNDRTTLDRALDQRLVLIVRSKAGDEWRLPDSAWKVRKEARFHAKSEEFVVYATCLPVVARPTPNPLHSFDSPDSTVEPKYVVELSSEMTSDAAHLVWMVSLPRLAVFIAFAFCQAGETIRQAAERTAQQVLLKTATWKGQRDDVAQLHFVGNCPAGWFWRTAKQEGNQDGNHGDKVKSAPSGVMGRCLLPRNVYILGGCNTTPRRTRRQMAGTGAKRMHVSAVQYLRLAPVWCLRSVQGPHMVNSRTGSRRLLRKYKRVINAPPSRRRPFPPPLTSLVRSGELLLAIRRSSNYAVCFQVSGCLSTVVP